MDASESVGFARDEWFVATREDYDAANATIAAYRNGTLNADAVLSRLEALSKGHLFLKISDNSLFHRRTVDPTRSIGYRFSGKYVFRIHEP